MPTSYRSFAEGGYLVHKGQHEEDMKEATLPVFTFRRLAEAQGWEVVESLTAVADPAGRTVRAVYETFRQEILDDLQNALPVDVVFFDLHGAMMSDGGAPGDSMFILRALFDRGVEGAAIATIWDPIAAGIAADAGEGARLALRIGGKMGPSSGDPVTEVVS